MATFNGIFLPNNTAPQGIEVTVTVVGCTYDTSGGFNNQTGTVISIKTFSEAGPLLAEALLWYAVGASSSVAYDNALHGNWGACDGDAQPESTSGGGPGLVTTY